jgi:hypothetical protein
MQYKYTILEDFESKWKFNGILIDFKFSWRGYIYSSTKEL